MNHIANLYNTYLVEFAEQHDFASCDLAAELESSYRVYYDDCHFNEECARKVSAMLANCITGLIEQRDLL